MDGKNIGDFVDADILLRLEELEAEEEALNQNIEEEEIDDPEVEAMKEIRDDITRKRKLLKEAHHLRVKDDVKLHRPEVKEIRSNLGSKGVDTTFMEQRMIKQSEKVKTRTLSQQKIKFEAKKLNGEDSDGMDEEKEDRSRSRSKMSRQIEASNRSRSKGSHKVLTAQEDVNS